ncbi:hypothetical protein [Croceimicrobium sp.]|uniref:hypothetical protein n=1 Tax=Croceimicrobium sp. TaxID=2828340 RepID=UPI003BAAECCC
MSKELSAEEIAKKAFLEQESGFSFEGLDKVTKKLVVKSMEEFATARLEAYREEFEKAIDLLERQKNGFESDRDNEPSKLDRADYEQYDMICEFLNSLNAHEYTEAEQNCKGCFGPCGYCRTKED